MVNHVAARLSGKLAKSGPVTLDQSVGSRIEAPPALDTPVARRKRRGIEKARFVAEPSQSLFTHSMCVFFCNNNWRATLCKRFPEPVMCIRLVIEGSDFAVAEVPV